MPFESPDWPLAELLSDIDKGSIQLPDFQREWKWDVDRIQSLLASVALGHPVGVVMMLENGSSEVNFATREIAGAPSASADPERLLLDGQQRLTSLYQTLFSGRAVDTADVRGKQMTVWFYMDIAASVDENADLEDDGIVHVPEDRILRSDFGRRIDADYSSLEREAKAGVFPLTRAFDPDFLFDFNDALREHRPDLDSAFKLFRNGPLKQIKQYMVPVIELKKSTPREAVCTVFEKVNTGGVALNVFELLTATFAAGAGDFRLNDDWKERKDRMRTARPVLSSVENTDFLQAIALLATRKRRLAWDGESEKAPGVSCKRKDVLKLTLDDYREWAEQVTEGFIWAGQFLNHQYVFRSRDLPYRTQLVPLAALRAVLGGDADLHGVHDKLARWYWCGVLGELYGGAVETRFARDLEQVEAWIAGGEEPGTVAGAAFNPGRLLTLRTRNSAAYKGLYALTMRSGVKDWAKYQEINQTNAVDFSVDIHHIFPKAWCTKNKIDHDRRESVINKTPLSRETNLFISGRSPSSYVPKLAERARVGAPEIDAVLIGHRVDAAFLRSDDFDGFFADRRSRMLELIEQAMGKPTLDESAPLEVFEDAEDDMSGDDDPDMAGPEAEASSSESPIESVTGEAPSPFQTRNG